MKPTKIQISPEVREFNEAVELADVLTDYKHDQESAIVLLDKLNKLWQFPISANWLCESIAGLAIKR